jgi:tRNA nucleotidyltransferase (CCA-adding enzyme)
VSSVLDSIAAAGGRPVIVGGAVRDWVMGIPFHDVDVEIFNVESIERLQAWLKPLGKLVPVGKAYGIFQYRSPAGTVDFSLPRLDRKVGDGHTGFEVYLIPQSSFDVAARRRDFTVNAMGMDWLTNQLLDPYGGQQDLKLKRIRHVSDQFSDDPLRVLRAIQFAGRLGFSIDPETVQLCRIQRLDELPRQRIYDEFEKVLCRAPQPSVGLSLLGPLGVVEQWVELGPFWANPKLWNAAAAGVDAIVKRTKTKVSFNLMLSVWLYHTQFIWKLPSTEIAGRFLARISESPRQISGILNLISTTRTLVFPKLTLPTDVALRRAATQVQLRHVGALVAVLYPDTPELSRQLVQRAIQLDILDQAPVPLVSGADLIALGIPEGPHIGELLGDFFEAQLEGKVISKKQILRIAADLWFGGDDDEDNVTNDE